MAFDSLSAATTLIAYQLLLLESTASSSRTSAGALLITRDERSGSLNFGHAAPTTHRSDVFGLDGSSSLTTQHPVATLAGREFFYGEHDLDCGICLRHRAKRLLLCCEFCSHVAHICCAGLTRVPQEFWLCAECATSWYHATSWWTHFAESTSASVCRPSSCCG
jgi:hypothetical protein